MTAVLLDSVKTGSTAWFAVRRGKLLKVQGMEDGDRLLIRFRPDGQLSIDEDGIFPLREDVEMVLAEHVKVAARKNGGVNVDILRKVE